MPPSVARASVYLAVEPSQRFVNKVIQWTTDLCEMAAPERLAEAVSILQGLRDAVDPVAYYDQLVLASAPEDGVSGLGLARIRAEGDLDLDFEVNGNQLDIVVEAKLNAEVPT